MNPPSTILIDHTEVRVDRDTQFICLTDIGNAMEGGGGTDYVKNWLRTADTLDFMKEWELANNPHFKGVEFDPFKMQAGHNRFRVSAGEIIEAGATGMIVKKGRYGGTYCNIDWTIHFTHWLSPKFYVHTVKAYRELTRQAYGPDALYHRFSRELVAENYKLITQANSQRKIPRDPHPMTSGVKSAEKREQVVVHLNQVDADVINLAMWGLTAKQWRAKFPELARQNNMRDFATPIELKVVNVLQIIMRHLQEDQYSGEEKLHRLSEKANEMVDFYCKNPEHMMELEAHRKKRGW